MGLGRVGELTLPIDDPEQVAARAALVAERAADVDVVLDGQPAAVDALLARGRQGQDDVCALRPGGDGTFVLVGGVVCFPSHWRLGEKVGRPMAAIHAPVPGYASALAAKVDAVLARLRPGQVLVRHNRLLHERGDLFAPCRPGSDGRPASEWWLRSERQALAALAGTDVVAFTIRTRQIPLAAVPARTAALLADQLRAEPDELAAYRGYLDAKPALVAFLSAVTDAP